jgi:hypothetical protein
LSSISAISVSSQRVERNSWTCGWLREGFGGEVWRVRKRRKGREGGKLGLSLFVSVERTCCVLGDTSGPSKVYSSSSSFLAVVFGAGGAREAGDH